MSARLRRYAIYAAVLLLLLGIAGLCGYCARDRAARQEAAAARRSADETALRAAGALTAERASRDELERESGVLREQLARVRAAVPDAEIREVVRWQTAACAVGGDPLPEPVVTGCGVATRPCLLRIGDQIDVRGVEATVETASGARGLVGEAEVWRLTPPETLLARASVTSGRILALDADLPRGNAPAKLRVYTGVGVGLLDVGGEAAAAYAAVLVGPGIAGSRWRPWAHAAVGAATVEIAGERRRPWSVTAGVGRDW